MIILPNMWIITMNVQCDKTTHHTEKQFNFETKHADPCNRNLKLNKIEVNVETKTKI